MDEIKTIKLPSGKEVKIKQYLTPRGNRTINRFAMEAFGYEDTGEFNQDGTKKMKMKIENAEALEKMEDAKINTLVTEIDGKTEGILDKALDEFSDEDFKELQSELNKVTNGETSKKK